jgi:hypothetical protein
VKARITISTNLTGSAIALEKKYSTTDVSLAKSVSAEELTLQTPGVVTTYEMEQNYPNPFNPSTTLRYQIPNAGHVTLKVYDVLGREVATLVDEMKESGSYTAVFNANKLASGVYFARFVAQSQNGNQPFTRVTKLLLTK